MAVFLSACSSLSGGGEKARGGDEIGRLITRETGEDARAAPGPSPSTFIGASVVRLDRLLGEPDLVRREGQNEFRRYDRADCRIYAVVAPAGGTVRTLTTGPLVNGRNAPSFPVCTAGL